MMRGNPWFRIGLEAWFMGIEAWFVIALRTPKLLGGGVAAEAEAFRMVSEKIESGLALQALALTAGLVLRLTASGPRRWQTTDGKCVRIGAGWQKDDFLISVCRRSRRV
jgi:hypothetical protein